VPQVRPSVPGPKMGFSNAFALTQEDVGVSNQIRAFDGLRPSFSAQVRFGEPGAPVQFLRVLLGGKTSPGGYCTVTVTAMVERPY
jgi:hypothetical protein